MGIVQSIIFYRAPVWANAVAAQNIRLLRKQQRVMAIRVIGGYHTTSFEKASLLADSMPWDLDAVLLAITC